MHPGTTNARPERELKRFGRDRVGGVVPIRGVDRCPRSLRIDPWQAHDEEGAADGDGGVRIVDVWEADAERFERETLRAARRGGYGRIGAAAGVRALRDVRPVSGRVARRVESCHR